MELRELVEDYRKNFVGKSCQVSTNYSDLTNLIVHFQATDLYHLFGLHKITSDYASQNLSQIESGKFDLSDFKGVSCYREVTRRIALYSFIADIFMKQATEYCIIRKDLSKNSMNLDLVFFEGDNRNVKVLGLRRDKSGFYRLVTLHESSARKYARVRKTKITGMVWL
ncbi:TPA: PBECR4 domain-containing protein [Streptococcus suis]